MFLQQEVLSERHYENFIYSTTELQRCKGIGQIVHRNSPKSHLPHLSLPPPPTHPPWTLRLCSIGVNSQRKEHASLRTRVDPALLNSKQEVTAIISIPL